MKKSRLFAQIGFVLGWGAPLGALALRVLVQHPSLPLPDSTVQEWSQYSFFYWYMLLGTCSVLTFVGFLLGKREDRIDYLKYRVAHPSTLEGRHQAHDFLKPQFQKHLELKKPISSLILGLDFFEKIGDAYGAPFKDTALKDFTRAIESCLRAGDRVIPYSEAAFLCVLPNCDEKAARIISDRIRLQTSKLDFPIGQSPIKPAFAIGIVTVYDIQETNYRIMIDESGKNLFEAQRRGSNGTVQTIFGKPNA